MNDYEKYHNGQRYTPKPMRLNMHDLDAMQEAGEDMSKYRFDDLVSQDELDHQAMIEAGIRMLTVLVKVMAIFAAATLALIAVLHFL